VNCGKSRHLTSSSSSSGSWCMMDAEHLKGFNAMDCRTEDPALSVTRRSSPLITCWFSVPTAESSGSLPSDVAGGCNSSQPTATVS
jgi:hypothetical protein